MSRFLKSLPALFAGLVAAGTVSVQASAQAPAPAKPAAQTLVDEAVKTAKSTHKVVLVDFSTTGCGWCKRFEKFTQSPEVGPIMANHFVFTTVQVEDEGNPLNNPGSSALMKSLGGEKSGYPFFAFLDENGKKIADSNVMPPNNGNIGHPAQPQEIVAFDALLQKTAPSMSADDRAKISAYLTEMQRPKAQLNAQSNASGTAVLTPVPGAALPSAPVPAGTPVVIPASPVTP